MLRRLLSLFRPTSPSSIPKRYRGKPLLRFLEYYALQAIDALDPAQKARLESSATDLQQTWQTAAATWPEVLEETLHLPAKARSDVRQCWTEWQQSENSTDAQRFAMAYADALCADMDPAE